MNKNELAERVIRENYIHLGDAIIRWREKNISIFADPIGNGSRVWVIYKSFDKTHTFCTLQPTKHVSDAIRAAARGEIYTYY